MTMLRRIRGMIMHDGAGRGVGRGVGNTLWQGVGRRKRGDGI